jgi:hypothetical protein
MSDESTGRTPNPEQVREAEERIRRRFLAVEREAETLRSRVRLLGVGLLVTLVLGGVGAFSQGIPGIQRRTSNVEVLTAKHIVLQAEDGGTRGEWLVDEEGNSRLRILDRRGRVRLGLTVLSSGSPGMSLVNANGRRRAALGLLPDESASLVFADASGVPRTVLGLTTGDAAQLVFADARGEGKIVLGLDEAGAASVMLPEDSVSVEGIEGGDGGP